jgi:type III secretory pathway component EscV
VGEPAAADAQFVVHVDEVESERGKVPPARVFCCMEPVQLRDAGLDVVEGPDPLTGRSGGWIEETLSDRAAAYGCRVMDGTEYVVATLEQAVRLRGYELLGIQQVQDLLDSLESTAPALVRSTVPKPVELRLLTDVCRRLLEEGVSLRHLEDILTAMARWAPVQRDPVALTELVRSALSRPISARHASADGRSIDVYVVSSAVEEAIRSAVHTTEQGSFLALDPEIGRDIIEAVGEQTHTFPATATRVPVLVTQSDVRRFLRRLIDIDHPRVAVLSYQEIDPSFTIHPVGEIRVGA